MSIIILATISTIQENK
ncbi:hypothetical protein ACVBCQ_001667 [Escherichia albertii]|nr:hypothetical protein [Escherichia coli]